MQPEDKVAVLYQQALPFLENAFRLPDDGYSQAYLSSMQDTHRDLCDKLADSFYSTVAFKARTQSINQWHTKLCRQAKRALLEEIKKGTGLTIRVARAHYKKTIVEAKQDWEADRWENIKIALANRDLRAFWNLIKSGRGEGSSAIEPNLSEVVWSQHFKNLYSNDIEANPLEPLFSSEAPSATLEFCSANISAPQCSMKEVLAALDTLLPAKAPGMDKIPGDLYRSVRKVWAPYLWVLFNALLQGMEIPPTWLGAEIVPIFKKGSPLDPKNYRPISLIDVSQKLYARFLLARLQSWLEDHQILTPLQAGLRSKVSTIDQVFRLQLIYWKNVVMEGGSLYLTFVDLKSAFDLVQRAKLWGILRDMGVPSYLCHQIERLHKDTFARARFGKQGELTAPFPVERGVRQGCVLAPTLFSLFLNGLIDDLLVKKDLDSPRLANHKIPALMFADDTLLLSKSPMGLQRTLKEFCNFCKNRKLEINLSKTKYMVFHAKTVNRPHPRMNGVVLERTSTFDYLGVTLNDQMGWGPHMTKANLKLMQSTGGILKVHNKCTLKTVGPPVEIYKTQARGGALYGVELWGHTSSDNSLTLTENDFLRRLLGLPRSTPLLPLRLDLGVAPIKDIIANRPLFFWQRLWSTPELISYREELKDVLTILGVGKMPWFSHIRHLCYKIGRPNLWNSPEESCPLISKKSLSLALKEHNQACLAQNSTLGVLTIRFLEVKHDYKLEQILDDIQPALAKKLYLQFRYGTLPLRASTNKWRGEHIPPLGCPGCN